jgi:hypothetical protein
MKDSTYSTETPRLLEALLELIEAHRPAFRQERTYRRSMGLVIGELFSFARHTVTQGLLALGLTDGDWSAWYRLFSRGRFEEEQLANCLLAETLAHVTVEEAYVIATDGVQIPRSSRKMPGTSWLKAPRTPVFRVGIHRAQRFLHGAWLTPLAEGFSRAIPLRFLPAFTEKAVPSLASPCREWQAGLQLVDWVRRQLDQLGRASQEILLVADGSYDVLDFWRGLPERTVAAIRCAKNRVLYKLPGPYAGFGRPASYGERAPTPGEWPSQRKGWSQTVLMVRGRQQKMRYRLLGPYLREGNPDRPLFLLVVGGQTWWADKAHTRRKVRKPAFYLISARQTAEGRWQLPLPLEIILAYLWQRWEVEVAHREMKSGFGVGQKQCWNPRSAIVSVQWSVWVYAVLLLAGYRTWGLLDGPPTPARWWPGAKRWSLTTLWRGYRSALWGSSDFRAIWTGSGDNWFKKEAWLTGLHNAVHAAARI